MAQRSELTNVLRTLASSPFTARYETREWGWLMRMRTRWEIAAGLILVGSLLYIVGYRVTPLAAAAAFTGSDVHEFGAVRYPWGEVRLLNTPQGPWWNGMPSCGGIRSIS